MRAGSARPSADRAAAATWALRALERLPALLALAFALVLLLELRSTVDGIYSNADVASAPVMGDLYDGGPVRLGYDRWFEPFWLERATAWLPEHLLGWTYGAYLLTLVCLAAVAWSAAVATRRRWTGVTFFAVPFCATAPLMMMQFAWSIHALAWVHVLLTGAFLVACAAAGGWFLRRRPVHLAVGALLGAANALGYASDRALAAALILPLLASGLVLLRTLPRGVNRRVGGTALAIGASMLVFAPVFTHIADRARITGAELRVHVTPDAARGHNLGLLWKAGPRLLGGDWSVTLAGAGRHLLSVLCAVVAAGLLVAGAGYAVALGLKERRRGTIEPALAVIVTFWALVTATVIGAFVFTSAPVDVYSSRYLVTAAYGVVVLAAVAAAPRPWSRALLGGAAALICFAGIVSMDHGDLRGDPNSPNRGVARIVSAVSRQLGVTKGYSGYWTAAPITLRTRDTVHIYPTEQCHGQAICPFYLQYLPNAYRDSHQRSMLVIDRAQPAAHAPLAVDPRFGAPIFDSDYGRIEVVVYPYDVARKLGPK